ncbi:MAG: glutamine--fructose-6-phosphate transaminase (isomerizing) [Candidatus Fonsibacter sp.]
MCGIIGIASSRDVSKDILSSLKKLEYRGYDSAGISIIQDGNIHENKCPGKVEDLEKLIKKTNFTGNIGIGHVRWATHGIPNKTNAHPHSSDNVSVVHNGIIENSSILKKELVTKGHIFKSQTDTEVVTHLLTENLKNSDLLDAVFNTINKLEGSFALGIIFKKYSDIIVGARKGSPLAVGYSNNENYLGSDSYALNTMTNKVSYLDDGEVCILKKNSVEFYDHSKKKINKKIHLIEESNGTYSKGNYRDFMLKEIFDQPEIAKKCINEYVDKLRKDINIVNFPIDPTKIERVYLIACGTAFHSCMVAKYWFEEFTDIDVSVDIASEFRYRKHKFKKNDFYIFVSQSGETADTIAALDFCKKNSVKTCSIINVVESSLSRLSDLVLPIHVGPEVGVASTKAFIGQIIVLMFLILKISRLRNQLNEKKYLRIIDNIYQLSNHINEMLKKSSDIESISNDFVNIKGSIFLGRGLSYPIALEGALKFKELTYIHAEGYPAGEMKHGPLALIEEGMPVVVIAIKDRYYEKTLSNMQEVIARGGKVLLISDHKDNGSISENIWSEINIPTCDETIAPILATIPLQLLAYNVALKKGYDIDKPRNLAKSVTVE